MRIAYWIVTGLMAAFMLMTSIPDVLMVDGAKELFRHLGYPSYFLPFIGVAKILGVAAVLVPGFRRLKEWAYAGLVFDLIGAFYSHIALGDGLTFWILPLIGLALVGGSYFLYHAVYDNPRSFRRIEGT
ncbi:MAG: DoxX family protein [Acidobacteriota bacterium]